jgi:GT2 family glycosyltransferase
VAPIVGGKYAPTDADGDALTITSVTGQTNGTVSFTATNITYTATNAGIDSFSYTVSDSFGGTASQTVNVVITSPNLGSGQGINNVSATVVNGTQEALQYLGIPGFKYALDETHSMSTPITWTPVLTNTAASDGTFGFTNTPSGGLDLYRTRYVP